MSDKAALGIDLGTTRSAMAHVTGGEPEVIMNSEGDGVTPSIVHLTADGESLVGEPAANQMLMEPDRTVREVKKLMGENETVALGDEEFTPQDVSALVLQKLVDDAEDRLGREVTNAVITVPAYFTDRERTATREAGEIAGLEVDKLLPEPSAAVLAYGLREQQLGEATNETVFVYDLGGGTFDATLVDAEYEYNYIETVATDGDNELGGSNWTRRIEEHAYETIEEDVGVDVTENPEQRQRINDAAKDAKHRLSDQQTANLTVPFVVPEENYNLDVEITREQFEGMTEDLIDRTRAPMDDILERTDYAVEDVDKVLLIGGSTRMPQVEALVTDYFDMEPSKEISPDRAVALGAAVQASIVNDDAETAPLPSGDESDEAGGLVLIDVLPQSIGVKVQPGNRFDPVVEQDAQLPTSERKEGYSVRHADQTSVAIEVYQGEAEEAHDNEFLGKAVLDDIPPRDPGQQSLAVEFTVNADGTLEVHGEDLLSDKAVSAEIESALETDSRDEEQLPPNA